MQTNSTLASPRKQTEATDRSTWVAAISRYETLTEQVEQVGKTTTAVHDAAEAACPRQDEFFRRYSLGCGDRSDRNFREAHMSLVLERTKERPLTPEEAKQVTADAQRIVDEFEAYRVRRGEAFAEYDRLEGQLDSLVDERAKAFHALMETPAPDGEALQYKIGLLASQLTEWESEDANTINAINADAARLLGSGSA